MTLYARAHLFTVLFVCAGALLAAVAYFAVEREIRAQEHADNLSAVVADVSELRTVSFEYILFGEARALAQARRKLDRVSERMNTLSELQANDPVARMRVGEFQIAFRDTGRLLTELRNRPSSSASHRRATELFLLRSQQMVTHAQMLQREVQRSLLEQGRMARWAASMAVAVLLALALLGLVLMRRSILKPLHQVTAAVETVGAGNLDVRLRSEATDEFGRVAHAFDRMLDRLQQVTVSRDLLNAEVKARESAQAALRDSEAHLRYVTEAADVGYWSWDLRSGALEWSPRCRALFEIGPEEPINYARFLAAVHHEDRARVNSVVRAALTGAGDYDCEFRTERGDAERWVHAKGRVDFGPDGQPQRMGGIVLDVTRHKETERQLYRAARHDALTGLPNRALFFEYARHLLAAAERHGEQAALLFIDLDRFKPINDTYGHETGDVVLREVARRLAACTRQEDLVGRLGGDEFVIMLSHVGSDTRRAAIIAEHVIDRLSQPIHVEELELSLSASVGLAHFPQHGSDIDALLRAADLAMYRAKRGGRAGYRVFTPELDRDAEAALNTEMSLRYALVHGGLSLHYQPVVDIRNGALVGAEALLRVRPGDGQTLSPQDFIPIAEAAGMIDRIGDWVVAEACRQISCWQGDGLAPLPIAVNVSPIQFKQHGFAERIFGILDAAGIPPHSLQIEITESTVMGPVDQVVATLSLMRAHGVGVALDDFGTGYSSLSVLSSLPLDKLKIDQSFVRNLKADPACLAVTRSIIGLAQSLHLQVVAEGVESEDDFAFLDKLGCEQAQGYLIGRPMTADAFAEFRRAEARTAKTAGPAEHSLH